MPMLIGHSQGGMIVVKVLHDLASVAGRRADSGMEPAARRARAAHHDRRSAHRRIAPGHRIEGRLCDCAGHGIAAAAAARTMGHPSVAARRAGLGRRLHRVFDSLGSDRGHRREPRRRIGATGTARVRNVVLPASYSHIALPRAAHLAAQPSTRAWIDGYRPGTSAPIPADADTSNLLHAADIWYSVKQHWCEGAKRLAARAALRASFADARPPEPVPVVDAALARAASVLRLARDRDRRAARRDPAACGDRRRASRPAD